MVVTRVIDGKGFIWTVLMVFGSTIIGGKWMLISNLLFSLKWFENGPGWFMRHSAPIKEIFNISITSYLSLRLPCFFKEGLKISRLMSGLCAVFASRIVWPPCLLTTQATPHIRRDDAGSGGKKLWDFGWHSWLVLYGKWCGRVVLDHQVLPIHTFVRPANCADCEPGHRQGHWDSSFIIQRCHSWFEWSHSWLTRNHLFYTVGNSWASCLLCINANRLCFRLRFVQTVE